MNWRRGGKIIDDFILLFLFCCVVLDQGYLIRKRVNYQYEAALLINLSIEPLQWVSNRVIWTYETSYEVKLMASGFELTLLGTFSNHTQS